MSLLREDTCYCSLPLCKFSKDDKINRKWAALQISEKLREEPSIDTFGWMREVFKMSTSSKYKVWRIKF